MALYRLKLNDFFLLGNVQRRFNGRLPLVVSLLQVYKRQQKLDGVGLYAIGFEIFQVCIALSVYGASYYSFFS